VDRRRFNKSILASMQLAEKLGLNPQAIQSTALENNSSLRALVDGGCSYLEYYQQTVDQRHLNFFVGDGDVLQFSFFEQGRRFSLRYAFFGSPYRNLGVSTDLKALALEDADPASSTLSESEALDPAADSLLDGEAGERSPSELGVDTLDSAALGGELDQPDIDGGGVSLRYEYAEDEYRRLIHPCAHLHVGWQRDGRLPVRRIWTPELFTAFVLRNMFADSWFRSQDSNTADMDGFEQELFFKRAKANATCVDDSRFHAFETQVLFLD